MPAGNMQLAIQITAEGRVDQVIRSINEQLKPLGQSLKPMSAELKEGERSLGQWGGHLREVRTSITETARKFAEIAPPLAALGGLVSAGGIGAAVYETAKWGRQLDIAAQSLAIIPPRLQSLQGAAVLGGGSVDSMTGSLMGLQAKLHGAAWGRDAAAMGFFTQIGAVRNGFNQIRNAADVLPEIADAVQRQTDPYVQNMILMQAGIDIRLRPAMLRGAAGLAEFQARFKKFGYEVTTEGRAALSILDQGFLDLGVAVTGTVQSLSVELAPAVTDIVNQMANWLAINRGWLGEKVHEGVDLITTSLKGVDWPAAAQGARDFGTALVPVGEAVGTIVKGLAWMAAHPTLIGAGTGVAIGSRFGPVGAGIGGLGGMILGNILGASPRDKAWNEEFSRWNREHSLGQDRRSAEQLKSDFDRANPLPIVGPQSAITPPPANWQGPAQSSTAEAKNDQINNWASMRARGGGWQSFGTPEAGVTAIRDQLGRYASGATTGRKLDTLQDIIGTWAPANENQTETLIARAERQLAIHRTEHMDLGNAETMRRLVSVMISNEHGGVLPRGAPQAMIDRALAGGPSWGNRIAGALNPISSAAAAETGGLRAAAGAGRLSPGGVNLGRVDPALVGALGAAVSRLPEGIRAVATSGERVGGLGGSRHHAGRAGLAEAMDLQLYGPGGAIPNRGEDTTGLYGGLARNFYEELARRHPEMRGKAAWGGNFDTSPGSGIKDLMHYDIGGDRGRYGSLAEQYRRAALDPGASTIAGRYRPEIAPPAAPEVDTSGIAAAAQTRHELQVSFLNAPAGMRSGMTAANGPADLEIRTEFAMSGPS
jgi:hypothetical protein